MKLFCTVSVNNLFHFIGENETSDPWLGWPNYSPEGVETDLQWGDYENCEEDEWSLWRSRDRGNTGSGDHETMPEYIRTNIDLDHLNMCVKPDAYQVFSRSLQLIKLLFNHQNQKEIFVLLVPFS